MTQMGQIIPAMFSSMFQRYRVNTLPIMRIPNKSLGFVRMMKNDSGIINKNHARPRAQNGAPMMEV